MDWYHVDQLIEWCFDILTKMVQLQFDFGIMKIAKRLNMKPYLGKESDLEIGFWPRHNYLQDTPINKIGLDFLSHLLLWL